MFRYLIVLITCTIFMNKQWMEKNCVIEMTKFDKKSIYTESYLSILPYRVLLYCHRNRQCHRLVFDVQQTLHAYFYQLLIFLLVTLYFGPMCHSLCVLNKTLRHPFS